MATVPRIALLAVTVVVALTVVASPVAAADGDGLGIDSPLDGQSADGGDGNVTVDVSSDGAAVGLEGSGGANGHSASGSVECEVDASTSSNPCAVDGPGGDSPPVEPPTEPPVEPPTEPPVEPPTQPPVEPPTQPPTEPPVEPPTEPPVEPPTEPPVEPPTQPPVEPPSLPVDPLASQRLAVLESQLL